MIKEITVPEIGEKVESGKVVAVLVAVGDTVAQDDGIIEFETDKAVVEIPSPDNGRIVEILVKEGDELKIGDVVARLETVGAAAPGPSAPQADAADATMDQEAPAKARESAPAFEPATRAPKPAEMPRAEAAAGPLVPAAPSVRRFAREVGVDLRDVPGSGPGGRISEQDVKAFLKSRTATGPPPMDLAADTAIDAALPDFNRWGPTETVAVSTVRRITAASMAQSWRIVPQVTQFDNADVSNLSEWIVKAGKDAAKSGGRLTITAVLLKVVAEGLKKFPSFNASFDMARQQIVLKHYVHIGLAVDTERGLLVPVIREADRKSIRELADEIVDLVQRARSKRLKPDEMEGGTFTLSNQGGIGGTGFTPIVYWPQVAILGVSRSSVEPRYRNGHWEPRTILPLSLSYDHRIIDGADAARFLRWIGDALEHPMALHL
jgi:pyruvate dehydrogenase E2 component (dihydrolipoamide acetyltransferase)